MPGLFDGTPLERPVVCDRCGLEQRECRCAPETVAPQGSPAPADQSPRVRRERRRGKWATIVSGLRAEPPELKRLLSRFRTSLGAGGGISDGELVLQGDHRDAVVDCLLAMGYRAKAAGG
ncbi:translation initiation factor Sui1 [Pirellulimonas nuda]|uniref:Translation initiation factor Sui1 n=1 Tax=Pirellulimonas nuda TaxID=2528009 RepID=A0A518DDZ1_9BACT|nr:translation initiation factor [Pirellulimonas nuda]QDU89698.1 translation initiation factor Sui1 [Pirellulimonas nuda]